MHEPYESFRMRAGARLSRCSCCRSSCCYYGLEEALSSCSCRLQMISDSRAISNVLSPPVWLASWGRTDERTTLRNKQRKARTAQRSTATAQLMLAEYVYPLRSVTRSRPTIASADVVFRGLTSIQSPVHSTSFLRGGSRQTGRVQWNKIEGGR